MEDGIFRRKQCEGLSYETTVALKILAILIVVVSHYFRYFADAATSLKILGSAGVFGVALFAFLSGYGVTKSYIAKGIREDYLQNKFCKVYYHL